MLKNISLILITLIIGSISVKGQTQFPPNIKWQETNTDHFRVIFPIEIEEYAKSTALIIDSLYFYDTKSYMLYPNKVDLVLYNGSAVSNAYAGLAPRKMQWYLTPPNSPSLTIQPWNEVLAIHEFRHVTQYHVLNSGFTKIASIVAGQYGQAVFTNWSVPGWFFEGDAIYSETVFSNSGRGRMPAFSLPIRTIALTNQKISYEKALFNSYKTYYPNHYYLGYYMVSYINRNKGQAVWNSILNRSAYYSFWPYSFERSIKKYTKANARRTYKLMMKQVDSLWTIQLNNIDTTPVETVNKNKKRVWTNYSQPVCISKDTLLAVKSGMDNNLSLIYLTTSGKEQFIRLLPDDEISYSKNYVVWCDYSTNPRFEEESFNDIILLNLKTKKTQKITNKKRYNSPAINNKADKIAAVTFNNKFEPIIDIVDFNGNIIKTHTFENYNNIFDIAWSPDDSQIAITISSRNGLSLQIIDVNTWETTEIIAPQWVKFERLIYTDKYIFFNYDYTGVTNIFAYKLENQQIYQVSYRPFSASQAAIDQQNNIIYLTDYSAKGTNITQMPLDEQKWTPIEDAKVFKVDYFKPQNPQIINFSKQFNSKFVDYQKNSLFVTKYKRLTKTFNVHSWLPYYDFTNIGYQLFSTNVLNDVTINAGFASNSKLKNSFGLLSVEYSGLFPVIGLSAKYGRDGVSYDKDLFDKQDTTITYLESNIGAIVSVPLNFSSDSKIKIFNFSLSANYENRSKFRGNSYDSLSFQSKKALIVSSQVSYTYRLPMTYRQLRSSFGYSIVLGINYIPKLENKTNNQYFAQARLFLPGLSHNHSLMLTFGYENKFKYDTTTYLISNAINPIRGFNYYLNDIVKFSADYSFPLFYPDINIPYLLFVKRIRTNLFFDYAFVNRKTSIYNYGFELFVDFNVLRVWFTHISIGWRFNFSPYAQQKSEFIMPEY